MPFTSGLRHDGRTGQRQGLPRSSTAKMPSREAEGTNEIPESDATSSWGRDKAAAVTLPGADRRGRRAIWWEGTALVQRG